MEEKEKKKPSGGSGGVTLILIVLLVLLLAGIGVFLVNHWENAPWQEKIVADRFAEALNAYNYQRAATVIAEEGQTEKTEQVLINHLQGYFERCTAADYTDADWSRYRGIEVFNPLITDAVYGEMDAVIVRFYTEQLTEKEAKTVLSRLGKFSFTDKKLKTCTEEIAAKPASDEAYRLGQAAFANAEWIETVTQMRKVVKVDPWRYPLAQEAIEYCRNAYGQGQIDKAERAKTEGHSEEAETLLKDLIAVFGEYPAAEELLASVQAGE